MRVLALAAACLSLLGIASAADAATPVKGASPGHLHGFLLRADEPVADSFPRTPSFAWDPVPGAVRYQFQLSTSASFRDSGLLYTATNLMTPVAAPQLTLPWITGNPHALFARVRAIKRSSTTPWSAAFGFDMEPAGAPKPLASQPGLLRWTPVEGADGYEIWLVDVASPTVKFEFSLTNVLDEREFYTFHRSAPWIGTVRWRVRAIRMDRGPQDGPKRQNGIPAVTYGPWSPVYTSSNPPYVTGPITLRSTVSDVVANANDDSSAAHRLMPGFTFTGDTAIDGTQAELFRVYAFTDRQCLNRVYTSSIIGGPAYAPRPYGPLALPTSETALTAARSSYLSDGSLFLPKRATRLYGAAQTSCGSSRSSYWRLPPVRTIGSPLPCANLSGDAKLRLDPDTETIVALSWLPAFPICTVSPVDKPVPLIAVVDVAPTVLTPAVAVLSAPGDTAATATTVQ